MKGNSRFQFRNFDRDQIEKEIDLRKEAEKDGGLGRPPANAKEKSHAERLVIKKSREFLDTEIKRANNWLSPIIDKIAPEHLQLSVSNPKILIDEFKNAGSIFLGRNTPEVIGDYIAGPNHVLPTSRTSRFASGLSVLDFIKRSSIIECSKESLNTLSEDAITIAEYEGLSAHALSI